MLGDTRMARRAGTNAAINETTSSISDTRTRVRASRGRYLEEDLLQNARQRERRNNADRKPQRHHARTLPEHERNDAPGAGAERRANADLAHPLGDGVCN